MILTALAGTLRFLSLGDVPPGLYHDEAFNGLDALQVLKGNYPIYFAANHGREPLFLYLIATTIGILGRTPVAVRMAAAICGTLTIPATYAMTNAWFNRGTALLSAAILSTTLWHVQLSRIGFRAVTLPLAIAAMLWSGARALRSREPHSWLLAGTLYGVVFYTYTAARLTPLALLVFGAYLLVTGEADRLWPGALYFGIGAIVTLIPLGTYAARHWDVIIGRPNQVSVLNPAVHQGDLWGTLGRHLIHTLGMFFVRGDTIARHNVPGRPIFTPLMGGAMILGTAQAAARARRRDTGSALLLIWVTTMLVPTLAAADAPHFLRAVAVLPPLVVLPALGLETLQRASAHLDRQIWGSIAVCLIMALSLGATVRDYFFRYGSSPEASYAFEAAATELAAEINRFTGTGWDGRGIVASRHHPDPERHVSLDVRLWQAWKGLSFLVPQEPVLTTFQPNAPPSIPSHGQTLLLLWPYDDLQPYLAALPHPAQVDVHAGPLTRGDLEKEAYPAYASYQIEPLQEQPSSSLARFGQSIELTDVSVEMEGRTWQVRLLWRARANLETTYTAFVAVCDDECHGERVIVQDDAPPGGDYYPTHWWHPGDVVIDVRTLELPARTVREPRIAVGLYAWPSLERLPITKPLGASPRDMLIVPVAE